MSEINVDNFLNDLKRREYSIEDNASCTAQELAMMSGFNFGLKYAEELIKMYRNGYNGEETTKEEN